MPPGPILASACLPLSLESGTGGTINAMLRGARLKSFDMTISAAVAGEDHVLVGTRLAEIADRFVFQLESSEAGYRHYQVRLQARQKMRLAAFIAKIGSRLWNGHVSVTSAGVHSSRNFNYVMKLDGRIAGPWSDKHFVRAEAPPMTRQLKAFLEAPLRPWQVAVEAMVQKTDDREVILIHDGVGGIGKSIFCEYLEHKGLAFEVPPFSKMEDLMAVTQAACDRSAFLIDMPRSIPKANLEEFYAGIETIKNGVAYDKRYQFKKGRFDRPQAEPQDCPQASQSPALPLRPPAGRSPRAHPNPARFPATQPSLCSVSGPSQGGGLHQ